jgi:two-component system cell cycle sensor histidine kinase/response regulator CckA
VLVADDEQAVRAVSMDFIGRLGFKAIGAADGEEALALFEAHAGEIAFVLLDLTMPKMDGVAAFHKMKIINPDVLVVLTSGYDEQEAIQRFNGEGLAGFIKKPFSMKTLNDLAAKLTGKTDWM